LHALDSQPPELRHGRDSGRYFHLRHTPSGAIRGDLTSVGDVLGVPKSLGELPKQLVHLALRLEIPLAIRETLWMWLGNTLDQPYAGEDILRWIITWLCLMNIISCDNT